MGVSRESAGNVEGKWTAVGALTRLPLAVEEVAKTNIATALSSRLLHHQNRSLASHVD